MEGEGEGDGGMDVPIETNRPHCPVTRSLFRPANLNSLRQKTVRTARRPMEIAIHVEAREFVWPDSVKLMAIEFRVHGQGLRG